MWQERFKSLAELTEDKLLRYAVEYEETGNYQTALEHYEKMKERDEDSIKRVKALIDMESENYQKALEVFDNLQMWSECLECSKNIGDMGLQKKYQIMVYRSERKYLELARYYNTSKEYQAAFDAYMSYFREEMRGSKDVRDELYSVIEKIDGKNFKKEDHDFITENVSEIPQLMELAVDISLVIKGDMETGIKLLEKLSKRSEKAEFNLFLLRGSKEKWDRSLTGLDLGGNELYQNFCLKGRNKKIDEVVSDNLSLENLDLFVENGYRPDIKSIDRKIIIQILEEEWKNLTKYYISDNQQKMVYKEEIGAYLQGLIDSSEEVIKDKFAELAVSPYQQMLELYYKHSENEKLKNIINKGLVSGEMSLDKLDKTYIDLVKLDTYLEVRKKGGYDRDNLLSSLDYKNMTIDDIFRESIDEEIELVLILFLEKKKHLISSDYYERLNENQQKKLNKYVVSYETKKIEGKYTVYNLSMESRVLKVDGKIYGSIEPRTLVELELTGYTQTVSLGDSEKTVSLKDIVLGNDKIIFE